MSRTLTFAYKHEFAILVLGTVCLLSLLGLYGWCAQSSAGLVSLRQDLEEANSELGTEIAVLETEYLRQTSGITMEMAYGLGFVDDSKIIAYALPRDIGPTLGQISLGNDL